MNDEDREVCPKCDDTGVMSIANGPDDSDKEWCTCRAGYAARKLYDELEERI